MKRQSLLIIGWLLLATPVGVQAQFTYTVTNQAVTITLYTGANLVVAIPSTIDGLPVTIIGAGAFADSSITSVTIPDTVISIEGGYGSPSGAFYNCSNLTSVTIPDSATNIGALAFAGCSSLTNVTIGSGVTGIGDEAFLFCARLTNIMVDPLNSAYSSVDGVLLNQTQTTLVEYPGGKGGSYTIPNSVTNILDSAFRSCTRLTSVTIPNSVTIIRAGAFADSSITSVTIPDSVTSIEGGCGCPSYGTFEDCTNLTSVTIPDSVTNIGENAFARCFSLTNVTLGSGLTSIGDYAFYSCTSLTGVTIRASVTSIGQSAFEACFIMTNIMVDPLNSSYSSVHGVLFDHSQTTLLEYPGGKLGYYAIPKKVTNIGAWAFSSCYRLTDVTVPDSVTSIGAEAFNGCTSLSSVYFQGNAPSFLVGTSVFDNDFATIYYLPGTVGWDSTFAGLPTAVWALPYPLILTSTPSFGIQSNQFGFIVSWASNRAVVVEAATDLAHPTWSPVQTNTLTSGSFYFGDPLWTNYPSRFYRIRSE